MWRLTRSTASATCTEAVPVQESMWNFMSTTTITTSTTPTITSTKGLVSTIFNIIIIIIIVTTIMFLQQLWQVQTPPRLTSLEEPLFFHTTLPLFLNTCLLIIFLQIRNPGLNSVISFLYIIIFLCLDLKKRKKKKLVFCFSGF